MSHLSASIAWHAWNYGGGFCGGGDLLPLRFLKTSVEVICTLPGTEAGPPQPAIETSKQTATSMKKTRTIPAPGFYFLHYSINDDTSLA
jgi:hypothetical protein